MESGEGKHEFVARRIDLRDAQFVGPVAGDAERVVAGGVVDDVAAIATRKAVTIVTRSAAQRVVAGASRKRVRAAAADDDVVARARLARDRRLHQCGRIPDDAIGEFDAGQVAAAECALDDELASGREGDDEVGRIDRGEPDGNIGRGIGLEHHGGVGDAARHLDAVDAFQRTDGDARILGEDETVMAGAGTQRAVHRQFSEVDAVLAGVRHSVADDAAHLFDRQDGPVGEDEALDRLVAVAGKDGEPVDAVADRDQQVAVNVAELDQLGRNARAEHDLVDAAGVVDAVAAVTDAEFVGVVAEPALERVQAGAAGERIVAVVEPDQMIVAPGAGQHAVDDGFDRQNPAVCELELLHPGGRQAVDDGQDVEAAAEIDDEVVAVASDDNVLETHGGAEHHAIDDAGRVRPLGDLVDGRSRPRTHKYRPGCRR